jgi:hypothetical protein
MAYAPTYYFGGRHTIAPPSTSPQLPTRHGLSSLGRRWRDRWAARDLQGVNDTDLPSPQVPVEAALAVAGQEEGALVAPRTRRDAQEVACRFADARGSSPYRRAVDASRR